MSELLRAIFPLFWKMLNVRGLSLICTESKHAALNDYISVAHTGNDWFTGSTCISLIIS
jgi:hypothetical protein